MKEFNKIKGQQGELLAQNFLKQYKYKILETNYTTKFGEIDIIAVKDNTIIFVEVKERFSNAFGRPCEAVTPYKQDKIRKVASYYLMMNGWSDENCRYDVIEVIDEKINHIENAFI